MGSVSEPQVGFWIPVARVKHEGDRLVAQDFGMFCAAMMLDNPISLLSGREDYGYPKTMGWSEMPDDAAHQHRPVHARRVRHGLRARRAPGAPAPDGPHADRRPVGDRAGPRRHPGRRPGGSRTCSSTGPASTSACTSRSSSARRCRDSAVNQVFLKQIRATADGRRADIQQVVVAPAITKNIKISQLDHDYELKLQHLDCHPLQDELGIVPEQTVTLAMKMPFDMLITAGSVRWAAPGTTNG